MDYRNILATGFLLLCGAVFVHSLKSANAFPQGPNVSMGSNPYTSFTGSIGGGGTAGGYSTRTLLTLSSDEAFIVTRFVANDNKVSLQDSNGTIINGNINRVGGYTIAVNTEFHTFISPGNDLKVRAAPNGNAMTYYVEGYYTHP